MSSPETLHIASNGMRFPALADGPHDGPVVLCLHGFPDTWHGFFASLDGEPSFGARLAAAGFRVIAPAMRGVTPATLPADGDYSPEALGADVIAHAQALGGKVHVVGNDWGALASYLAAVKAPERIARMVTLGIPHPLALRPSLGLLWSARHFVTFQFQRRAAKVIRKDGFAYLDKLYRRWSPSWHFPPAALADVKAAYAEPGVVEGALAPYAAIRRERAKMERLLRDKIVVPTLALGGGADPGVPTRAYEAARRGFASEYRWDLVPNVGHFVHREDSAATAERVVTFLRSG